MMNTDYIEAEFRAKLNEMGFCFGAEGRRLLHPFFVRGGGYILILKKAQCAQYALFNNIKISMYFI